MTRVDQLLNSVVFGAEPILRELEHFEVRYGTAAPTSGDYPEDGFGLFIDETADDVYACLQWRGEFYVVGGSTGVTGEINTASNLGRLWRSCVRVRALVMSASTTSRPSARRARSSTANRR